MRKTITIRNNIADLEDRIERYSKYPQAKEQIEEMKIKLDSDRKELRKRLK